MKKLLLASSLALLGVAAQAQTARIQFLHNSADPALDTVDIWVGSTLVADNFAFRTATAFMDISAGTPVIIGIAPKNSTSDADALDQTVTTFTAGQTYIATASGQLGSGFNPAQSFALIVYAAARESAAVATNTDLLVINGASDLGPIDLRTRDLGTVWVDSLNYGEYTSYWALPTGDSVLALTDAAGSLRTRYSANLATLGLAGHSAVLLASGFLNPANNSNGESVGLWLARSSGGAMLELPVYVAPAVTQNTTADFGLQLYPSPADLQLTANFNLSAFSPKTSLAVIDITGQILSIQHYPELPAGQQQYTISLADLPAGAYFLQLQTSQGLQVQPFSIQR